MKVLEFLNVWSMGTTLMIIITLKVFEYGLVLELSPYRILFPIFFSTLKLPDWTYLTSYFQLLVHLPAILASMHFACQSISAFIALFIPDFFEELAAYLTYSLSSVLSTHLGFFFAHRIYYADFLSFLCPLSLFIVLLNLNHLLQTSLSIYFFYGLL